MEGFSDLEQLSPLCRAEGPSEKMGRVEYGLEGSRICHPKRERKRVSARRAEAVNRCMGNFMELSLPFCNTVSTRACGQNNKSYLLGNSDGGEARVRAVHVCHYLHNATVDLHDASVDCQRDNL